MIVHPAASIGPERVRLVLIDDAHPCPSSLRDHSAAAKFARPSNDLYPGIRAEVPQGYCDWLTTIAAKAMPFGRSIVVLRSTFAIATLEPTATLPLQRIPHFDTVDTGVMAAVHYLCDPPYRGTSFYRHRRTGYQYVDASRRPAWRNAMAHDYADFGVPAAGFPADSTTTFELLHQTELIYNRLIIYPANCLHSGDLSTNKIHDGNLGRLTITSLIR